MRLLLIEDEPELSTLVSGNLSRAGFAVDTAKSLDEAGAAVRSMNYEAILLDLRLPDGDGLALLKSLRGRGDKTPVIVLTARDAVADRVRGLNAGADDYLIKPFAIEELVARINAILRRPNENLDLRLRLANLEFDTAHREALVGGQPLALPRRELGLFELLLRRAGRVVTRDALQDALYGEGDEIESNAVDANLSRLRKRLSEAGAQIRIRAVRGVGYLMQEAADDGA
ncbi:MAG TPA: response regulator transcription factor [Dongiaceae bacterium]